MPVQIVAFAKPTAKTGKANVGDILEVRDMTPDPDRQWGESIVPPDFVIFAIPDAVPSDIAPFTVPKQNTFTYEQTQLTQNNERWRISTPTSLVQDYGQKAFPQSFVDIVVNQHGGTVFQSNIESGFAVFNFTPPADIDGIKATVNDVVLDQMDYRRYRLSDAFINQALAAGGFIEKTLSEITNAVQDKIT